MLFKLLYLPSATTITPVSAKPDTALRSEKPIDVLVRSRFRSLITALKTKLAGNCRRAVKAQIDSLLP